MADSRSTRSPEPLAAAREALEGRVAAGQALAVGLSGGLDSVVLLDCLCRLRGDLGFRLSALHVHHGLNPRADHWAEFCAELAGRMAVPLEVRRVSVPRRSPLGLEAAAREARYRVFGELECDWLALAHHRDDQAETVLLNLLRGGGVRGAAGIPRERALAGVRAPIGLLRPLLPVSRSAIQAHASRSGLAWIEDDSNLDVGMRRNFLRHEVMPMLRQRFPQATSALAAAAGRFAEAKGLLRDLARIDLEACAAGERRLDAGKLLALPQARQRNLMLEFLRDAGADVPQGARLDEFMRQLRESGAQARPALRGGRWSVRCFRGMVHVVPETSAAPGLPIRWNGEAELGWGGGSVVFDRGRGVGIRLALLREGAAVLRRREGGERLRLNPRGPSRSLKNLLQEAAVPPWERRELPVLWCSGEPVWVPGVGIAAEARCAGPEQGVIPRWKRLSQETLGGFRGEPAGLGDQPG